MYKCAYAHIFLFMNTSLRAMIRFGLYPTNFWDRGITQTVLDTNISGPLKRPKVVALIVNLVMGLPGLDYSPSSVLHHLELFAGDCAVSRGEHMDFGGWWCDGVFQRPQLKTVNDHPPYFWYLKKRMICFRTVSPETIHQISFNPSANSVNLALMDMFYDVWTLKAFNSDVKIVVS